MSAPNPTHTSINASAAWPARRDVIYHFSAYYHFAPSTDNLHIINLTDSDKEYYNHIATTTTGLNTPHHLAAFLKEKSPSDFRNTFLRHVQEYNRTVVVRNRIYLLGVTDEDLQVLGEGEGGVGAGKENSLLVATSGIKEGGPGVVVGKGVVEGKVEECLRVFEGKKKVGGEVVEKMGKLEIAGGSGTPGK